MDERLCERRMEQIRMLLQVSECLRRKRFGATCEVMYSELRDVFGVDCHKRTVYRYLGFLADMGCAEVVPNSAPMRGSRGVAPTTWKWKKGIGLLAMLDERAAQKEALA